MNIERRAEAAGHDPVIHGVQESIVQRIERCVGAALHTTADIGRGTLNLGAFAAGNIAGAIRDSRQAFKNGLNRGSYPDTKTRA